MKTVFILISALLLSQVLLSFGARRIPSNNIERLNERLKRSIRQLESSGVTFSNDLNTVERSEAVRQTNADGIKAQENSHMFSQLLIVTDTVCWAVGYPDKKLWKSTDSMYSWSQVTTPSSFVAMPISYDYQVGGIVSSDASSNALYVYGNGSTALTTTDGGQNWNLINQSIMPVHLRLHPKDYNYALAWSNNDMYYTKDFARTWTKLVSRVYDFAWCNPGNNHQTSYDVCLITDTNPGGSNPTGLPTFVIGDINTLTYRGNTHMKAHYMIEHPKYLFVIADSSAGFNYKNLYISTDNGSTLNEAQIPGGFNIPDFDENQLLDDRGSIVISSTLDGRTNGPRSGNLYVGDGTSFRFTTSLEQVFCVSNWWDFDMVRSLEGVFLANVVIGGESGGTLSEPELQTQITFDNGDTWNTLKVPNTTYNGDPVNCVDTSCTLNLFGRSTWLGGTSGHNFGDFWSSEVAVGLVMATGNIGHSLAVEPQDVNTYLSVDGGANWKEVFNRSTVYEFGDHGGVLVMVPNQVLTNTLQYSTDFGRSWKNFTFTDRRLVVVNLFTSSSRHSVFNILGVRNNVGTYVAVDFADIASSDCTNNDFEDWELTDELNADCLLGHITTYRRRKFDKECDVPDNFNPIKSKTNCDCSRSDYECEIGFETGSISGKCLALNASTPVYLSGCSNGKQWVSTGYRKVPGDTCVNDIAEYMPKQISCSGSSTSTGTVYPTDTGGPTSTSSSSTGASPIDSTPTSKSGTSAGTVAAVVIVIIVIVAALLVGGVFLARRTEFFKDKLNFINFDFFKRNSTRENVSYNQLQMNDDDEA